jgi:hypothetical protein
VEAQTADAQRRDQPMSDREGVQPGMLRIVETRELRKEAKVVLIFIDQPRNRVIGIDYDYLSPFQMYIEQVELFDALKMRRGSMTLTDVVLTLTTERLTGEENYGLKIKDIHPWTPEEREHLAPIIALVNKQKAR